MRELNECKAEVFRRSESRRKARKKNVRRTLALCVPLCLIVTVWSVTMLPAREKSEPAQKGVDRAGSVDDTEAVFVRVEVLRVGDDLPLCVLEAETNQVTQIVNTINSAFAATDEESDESPNLHGSDWVDTANSDILPPPVSSPEFTPGYKVRLITDDGTKMSYTLSGYTITNDDTCEQATLTEEQYTELLRALHLAVS